MSGRVRGGPRMAAMWSAIVLGCLLVWIGIVVGLWMWLS